MDNAAYMKTQFWDGRSPSLEDQALLPPLNPVEMGLKTHEPILKIARSDPEYAKAFKAVFGKTGKDVTMAFQPTLIVNDVEAACELAASGLGIVQPPSNYAAHYLKSQQLVQVLSRFAATPWRVYLCYPNRSKLPLRVRAFIEFARDHLKHASALTGFDDKPRARRSSR